MSKEIKFRTKFLELVKGQDIEALEAAVCKFIQMDPDSALDYLWRMTYESDEDISKTMNELGLADVSVDRIKLRNELRHQYGSSIMQKPSEEYFAEMEKRSDTITAFVVWKRCEMNLMEKGAEGIDRTLFLLSSSQENLHFGGLRAIGFSFEEAVYLKKYHEEIGALLKAIYTEMFQSLGNQMEAALRDVWNPDESSEETDMKYNIPNAEQKTEEPGPQKQSVKEPEDQETGETQEEESSSHFFYCFSGEDVLTNREAFENFVEKGDKDSIHRLIELGYDLNEVFGKEQEIKGFIEALRKLEG